MVNNKEKKEETNIKIVKNKGKNAGGKNTNKNGLEFEKETNYEKYFLNLSYNNYSKNKFKQFLEKEKIEINLIDGCKSPDECYINFENKHIIIIEKKFQNNNGSVCEKIQTAPFKKYFFEKLLPTYKITYAYILSKWFETNCNIVIELLRNYYNIPILIAKDKNINYDFIDKILL